MMSLSSFLISGKIASNNASWKLQGKKSHKGVFTNAGPFIYNIIFPVRKKALFVVGPRAF